MENGLIMEGGRGWALRIRRALGGIRYRACERLVDLTDPK